MTPTAAAILEGMPEPKDLHRAEHDGMTFVSAGSAVLAWYPSGDAGMRNVTVAVLRQLGFGGQAVAAVMGLTENYVADWPRPSVTPRGCGFSACCRGGKPGCAARLLENFRWPNRRFPSTCEFSRMRD